MRFGLGARPFTRHGVAVVCIVAALGAILTPQAMAAIAPLSLVVTVDSDGSAPFDASSGAGLDTGAANGVVRSFDTITYRVDWTASNQEGVAIDLVLSGGSTWAALPEVCRTSGSDVSVLAGASLHCALGSRPDGSVGSFTATAQVGAQLDGSSVGLSGSISSTANSVPATAPTVQVSAAPRVDLRSQFPSVTARDRVWNASGTQRGWIVGYPVTLEVPAGGRGAEPLGPGDLHFQLDLSALPSTVRLASAVGLAPLTPPVKSGCRPLDEALAGVPFGRIGITTAASPTNSTEDSGTWTCTESGTGVVLAVGVGSTLTLLSRCRRRASDRAATRR